MTLVLPVETPPCKRRGSMGEFGGPIRRKISRTCAPLPGKFERRVSMERGSSENRRSLGRDGRVERGGFGASSEGLEREEEDLVVLLSGVAPSVPISIFRFLAPKPCSLPSLLLALPIDCGRSSSHSRNPRFRLVWEYGRWKREKKCRGGRGV